MIAGAACPAQFKQTSKNPNKLSDNYYGSSV